MCVHLYGRRYFSGTRNAHKTQALISPALGTLASAARNLRSVLLCTRAATLDVYLSFYSTDRSVDPTRLLVRICKRASGRVCIETEEETRFVHLSRQFLRFIGILVRAIGVVTNVESREDPRIGLGERRRNIRVHG